MKTLLIALIALSQGPGDKPALPKAKADVAVVVTVRPTSEIGGASITLADIAEVTGSDKELVAKVSAVEVGTSPLVGLSRTLLKADIITRLKFNQIAVDRIELNCAPSIMVTRTGAEVAVPEVVEFAKNTLIALRHNLNDSAQIEALPIPYKWVVPPGKREMQSGPSRGALDGNLVTIPVTVLVDGKPVKTVEVNFRLKRMTAVLVATHQLEAHAVLKAEDISLTTQEVAPGTQVVTDAAQAIGMRTTRQIAAGGLLTRSAIESQPVVLIGAPVTVQVIIGHIAVEASGIARSQGAIGDRVRVFLQKTNKEVNATVVDAKTVRVEDNG